MDKIPASQKRISPGLALALILGAAVLLLAVGYLFFGDSWISMGMCLVFWAIFFVPVLYRALRRFAVASRVGLPELTLSKNVLRPGEEFNLSYQHTFKNAAELKQITLQLVLHEKATRGSGTDRTTKEHKFTIQKLEVPGRHIEPGEMFYTRQNISIPRGAMHTFESSNNKLDWSIEVKTDFQGMPDYEESLPIQVLAEAAL